MTIPLVNAVGNELESPAKTTSGELFDGFFTSGKTWGYDKNAILDARGRRLFGMMSLACQEDCYPYQVPLESRTGPWVQAEGRRMLMLSSYDYLSLVGDPRIEAAAIAAVRQFGSASGG